MRARRYLFAGVALVLAGLVIWWLGPEQTPIARSEPIVAPASPDAESVVATTTVVAADVSAPALPPVAKLDVPAQPAAMTVLSPVAPVLSAPRANDRVAAPVTVNVPGSAEPISEIARTRRMYGAHAPLRVSEVANPDSVANRMVLQSMVQKALARAQAEPAPKY